LSLCLGALIICVRSALHLGIPERRHKKRVFGVRYYLAVLLCPRAAAIYQRIDASLLESDASLKLPFETQADPGYASLTEKVWVHFASHTLPLPSQGSGQKGLEPDNMHSASGQSTYSIWSRSRVLCYYARHDDEISPTATPFSLEANDPDYRRALLAIREGTGR